MISPAEARSGKGHRDENFPVASRLIHPRHRAPILAFYEFVRTADDIADHATLAPQEKLDLLDRLEATLLAGTTTTRSASPCARSSRRASSRPATRRTCSPRSAWM
jgi:phytoene/squalene synthetase